MLLIDTSCSFNKFSKWFSMNRMFFLIVIFFVSCCFGNDTCTSRIDVKKFENMKIEGNVFIGCGSVIAGTGFVLAIIGYGRDFNLFANNSTPENDLGLISAAGVLLGTGVPMLAGGIFMRSVARNKLSQADASMTIGVNTIALNIEF